MSADDQTYLQILENAAAHRVHITGTNSHGETITISGIMEHDFQPQMSSEWTTAFQSLAESTERINNIANTFQGLSALYNRGVEKDSKIVFDPFSLKNQLLSRSKWINSNPVVIPITLTAVATKQEKAKEQVVDRLIKISAASYPDLSGTLGNLTFEPPMGYLPFARGSNDKTGLFSLTLGDENGRHWLQIKDYLLLRAGAPTFSKSKTHNGYPLWGSIYMQFFTHQTPAAREIKRWFGVALNDREAQREPAKPQEVAAIDKKSDRQFTSTRSGDGWFGESDSSQAFTKFNSSRILG